MPKILLLADDSVTVQRVVELTFAHEDIRVVSVGDGRRAVQALDAEGADIVLVDVEVPEIDGYGVAAHVRQSEKLRGVPVVLMAGALGPVDEARARELGCAAILTKPFEPQALVKRVKELLNSAPARPGGASIRPARYQPGSKPEPLEPSKRPVWESGSSPAPARPASEPEAQKRSLVEAFSALLGADQLNRASHGSGGAPPPAPAKPSLTPAPAPSQAELEAAVRRVLDKMTADAVRQIVAETAERLVREEIDRIKADSD